MAITSNFVTLKHGHIVATELSRAQLCCTVQSKVDIQDDHDGVPFSIRSINVPPPSTNCILFKVYLEKLKCRPYQAV